MVSVVEAVSRFSFLEGLRQKTNSQQGRQVSPP